MKKILGLLLVVLFVVVLSSHVMAEPVAKEAAKEKPASVQVVTGVPKGYVHSGYVAGATYYKRYGVTERRLFRSYRGEGRWTPVRNVLFGRPGCCGSGCCR